MRFASDDEPEDFDLDEEFPLGDGTADVSGTVVCPYCGEENDVSLDPGSGAEQDYVEDCQVCCQPWRVSVHYREDGSASVTATALDE
jgi:hypothetical protein